MSVGVEQLKTAVEAVADIGTSIAKLVEGGRFRPLQLLKQAPHVIKAIHAVAGVSKDELLAEVKDLSDEESDVLVQSFETHFHLSSADKTKMIDEGFEMVVPAIAALVELLKLAGVVKG